LATENFHTESFGLGISSKGGRSAGFLMSHCIMPLSRIPSPTRLRLLVRFPV
jgi:hypothetical protein